MAQIQLSEQEKLRRESLNKLKELGISPFPQEEYQVSTTASEIKSTYDDTAKNLQHISIAGRIMSRRIMGAASFTELQDHTGRIQLYFHRDTICPDEDKTMYNTVFKKLLDIGDIIGITGNVFITKMGEISVHVSEFKVLAKSIRPLPIVKEKEGQVFDAVTDPEFKYRQRYADLIVNPEVRDTFIKRTHMINTMRKFFNDQGYLEVETPILQPIPGGATAKPFITHHNYLDIPLYLRIANELYLKRLIVGGFEGVYEFAKDFRNEGMDRNHNPEFTVMEIYVAYKDYLWMMDFTEALLEKLVTELYGTTEIKTGHQTLSFKRPFKKVSLFGAIKEHTGIDVSNMNEQELRTTCDKLGIETTPSMGKGKLIDELFGETAEKHYIQPTFIMDYPVEMSPLCKKHREDDRLTERFELMINGQEICNAYTELNDPIDQLDRFRDQLKLSEKGDDEAMYIDQDFIRSLEYGMPPTSGMGIGIDRLAMILMDQPSIQDVLFFPQMRPEQPAEQKDPSSEFKKMGIPEEWSDVLQQMGYESSEALKNIKPGKLFNDLCGFNKKNKLGLQNPTPEDIKTWLS